jgi:hypothetical protein
MPTIETNINGKPASLETFPAIKREQLHGETKIIPKLGNRTLEKAWLRPNGGLLLKGEKKSVEIDPHGSPVEKPTVQIPSEPEAPRPHTLIPADISIIPEYQIDRVIPVDPKNQVPPGVYKTTYKGPRSSKTEDALLICKDKEAFLLVGEHRPTLFIGHTPNYAFFTDPEPEETEETSNDELDINF